MIPVPVLQNILNAGGQIVMDANMYKPAEIDFIARIVGQNIGAGKIGVRLHVKNASLLTGLNFVGLVNEARGAITIEP